MVLGFTEHVLAEFGYILAFQSIPASSRKKAPDGYSTSLHDPSGRRVVINSENEAALQLTTALHELGHVYMGHTAPGWDYGSSVGRRIAEVEAEGFAFVVASLLGLDTYQYSVPYADHWATNHWLNRQGSDDVEIVKTALGNIKKASQRIRETYFVVEGVEPWDPQRGEGECMGRADLDGLVLRGYSSLTP